MKSKLPEGNYSKEFLAFFDYICEKAAANNKIIDIRNTKYVSQGGRCAGYCDGERIVVAGKAKDFEMTLLHEWSHCEQAIENNPYWQKELIWPVNYSISDFDNLYRIMLLERDCESRSLKTSRKWNLFDNELYAKKANSYLHFHQFLFLKKKWVFFKGLYQNQNIIDAMPSKILSEKDLKKIDMDIMKLYDIEYHESKTSR